METLRAFLGLATGLFLLAGLWNWARHQPEIDGIPAPFRRVLSWNGELWQALFRPERENKYPPPERGKRPRFNGDLGLRSPIDLATWSFAVVREPRTGPDLKLGMPELRLLPRTDSSAQFYCIEGWSDPISYAGVRFSDFLKHIQVSPSDFRYVGLETPDREYYVSIDMESMLHPQTLLAYEMNGKPLDLPNGSPLRLIIPVKYGIKSLKRIGRITLSNTKPPDYWAERGYDWFAGL